MCFPVHSSLRKHRNTYLSCPAGAGFSLQLLPESSPFGYHLTMQLRLPQLPTAGKLASVVSVLPPVVVQELDEDAAATSALQQVQLNFFADEQGYVGLQTQSSSGSSSKQKDASADAADTDTASVHASAGRLKAGMWCRVTISFARPTKDSKDAKVSVAVARYRQPQPVSDLAPSTTPNEGDNNDASGVGANGGGKKSKADGPTGRQPASASVATVPYFYPSGMVVFNGGSIAEARGGDICQAAVVAWKDAPLPATESHLLDQFDAGIIDPYQRKMVRVCHISSQCQCQNAQMSKSKCQMPKCQCQMPNARMSKCPMPNSEC